MPSSLPWRILAARLVRWHSLAYSIFICGHLLLLTFADFLWSQGASRLQRRRGIRVTRAAEPGVGASRDEGDTPGTGDNISGNGDVSSQRKAMHVRFEDAPTPAVNAPKRKLDPGDYTVGWICALKMESFAARALLDEEHEDPAYVPGIIDTNYTFGRVGEHNVVIVVLPEACTDAASIAAQDLSVSFPNIRFGLMVGIGGGAPSLKHDIRLGDIIVGIPHDGNRGVFQYDFSKTMRDGSFHITSFLNPPPNCLQNAVNRLDFRSKMPGRELEATINSVVKTDPRLGSFKRPHSSTDRLYRTEVTHPPNIASCETSCGNDPMKLVRRHERRRHKNNPTIHYGAIASASQLVKDAFIRDKLIAEKNILCFEAEATGLISHFPCLVIRSIYNYADSHYNNKWQRYAAITAAAYAKDLLDQTPLNQVKSEERVSDILKALENPAKWDAGASQAQHIAKQRAAHRSWSSEELQCLESLRLAGKNENTAYEWYKDRVEDPLEGTCQWFLQQDYFQRWLKQDSGILLVLAGSGYGKSVLAKYLVDHGLPKTSTICYFFFQKKVQDQARQALCALLHQLFSQNPSLIDYAMLQFRRDKQGLINSTESLWGILGNAVKDSQAGPIIFVLDALDECAESDFKDLIQNIQSQPTSDQIGYDNLKYVLTTRPNQRISSAFYGKLPENFLHITILENDAYRAIREDVSRIITHRVNQLSETKGLSTNTQIHLEKTLQEQKHHRSQLWVDLVFKYLEKGYFTRTPRGIEFTISALPTSVHGVYERIVNMLKAEELLIVQKVLSVILAANRPLTISEVNIAVSLDDTSKSIYDIDLEEEEKFLRLLQSWCGLFISIYQGSIYFHHETAREFLLDNSSSTSTTPSELFYPSISLSQAHTTLAEACVLYLNLLNADLIPPKEAIVEAGKSTPNYAFLDYSAKNWGSHLREANITNDAGVIAFVLRICDPDSNSYAVWFEIYKKTMSTEITGKLTDLMLASYYGHRAVVELLLKRNPNIEEKDGKNSRTPLSWAAENGHEAVVRLLLEKGANIDTKDNQCGQTPLLWATKNGHEAVIRLLLEKGANIETKDNQWSQTPLLWATKNGHEAVIRLLLEKGANIEAMDSKHNRTPLSWAAENGHEAVVRLLLEKGAKIETKDNQCGQTPLLWATKNGHEAVIRLLLEKGANIEAMDSKHNRTPLSWAAESGHEGLVTLLLQKGADAKTNDKNNQTPLFWAAKTGHEAVVQLLLERGATVEASHTIDGQAPLSWAAENGHEVLTRLLLDQGADIETKNKSGWTPLLLCANNGHEVVVKLLLERGATIESKDAEDGRTPLSWAAENGHKEVVNLLLEKGAYIEAKDTKNGRTPLSWAAERGHGAVVKLLLQRVANVETQDTKNGRRPLSWAAEKGHKDVVALLIDSGSDFEARDNNGQTPLLLAGRNGYEAIVSRLLSEFAGFDVTDENGRTLLSLAAEKGYGNIVRLLLKYEAPVDPKDGETSRTPLSWAVEKGHEDIVRLLLEFGADVGSKDYGGQTPLSWAQKTEHKTIVALLQESSKISQREKETQSSDQVCSWDPQVTTVSNHNA